MLDERVPASPVTSKPISVDGRLSARLRSPVVRYICIMVSKAVLQQVLEMPADERAELIEHLIDSLEDEEVELRRGAGAP